MTAHFRGHNTFRVHPVVHPRCSSGWGRLACTSNTARTSPRCGNDASEEWDENERVGKYRKWQMIITSMREADSFSAHLANKRIIIEWKWRHLQTHYHHTIRGRTAPTANIPSDRNGTARFRAFDGNSVRWVWQRGQWPPSSSGSSNSIIMWPKLVDISIPAAVALVNNGVLDCKRVENRKGYWGTWACLMQSASPSTTGGDG